MRFIQSNNVTHCVQRDGNPLGQSLVFINSLGSDYRIWDEVVPHLTDYDCIRYDKRGHGLSDCPDAPYSIADFVDDLHGLLDNLSLNTVVLIGISVGGMIAMDFAARYPQKVAALILLDTFPKIGTEIMWRQRINVLREHGMASLAGAILGRWFTPSFKEKNNAAYIGYRNMLMRMPVVGYTGTCEAIRDADLTDAARTIASPTLVLCGAEDQSTPPDLVRGLIDLIPNTRYTEIQGAGHLPPVEKPNDTAQAINTFLKAIL